MMDRKCVANANVEPNKPTSSISLDKNAAESIAEQTWKPSQSKRSGIMAEDDINAIHPQMYEGAINLMQKNLAQ